MHRALVLLVAALAFTSCGAEETETGGQTTRPDPAESNDGGTGSVAVRIEEVAGVFIEGFEVGLRFETPGGDVIGSTLWSEFVANQKGERSTDDFYDSVLEQAVPAGEVIVLATVNVGMGPPPETPDIDGDLRCRLTVDVPRDGRVEVEVSFDDGDDCLRPV